MKLMLDFPALNAPFKIRHQHALFFMGSCFAENMSIYFQDRKFKTKENPFGVLYNPVSLARALQQIETQAVYDTKDFYQQKDVHASWDHHSKLACSSAEELKLNLENNNTHSCNFLKKANVVFLTLGTAWVSILKSTGQVVANNHQAPKELFDRKLLGIDEISEALRTAIAALQNINSELHIVLSVSPVRHAKQGLAENNRSKARLIEGVHAICDEQKEILYLPSYEIILDALRDYRFFKEDLVHPNKIATDLLWSYLEDHLIEPEDLVSIKKALEISMAKRHKLLRPDAASTHKFIQEQLKKMDQLQKEFPFMDLEEEKKYFENL